jgi:hypothetical protein
MITGRIEIGSSQPQEKRRRLDDDAEEGGDRGDNIMMALFGGAESDDDAEKTARAPPQAPPNQSSATDGDERGDGDGMRPRRPDIASIISRKCYVDTSSKMRRTADYWGVMQRLQDDALAKGIRMTIGPCGYTGYRRLKMMEEDFINGMSKIGKSWELHQSDVFKRVCNINIKLILGRDVDSCLDATMDEYGWTSVPTHLFCLAYRGAGKSQIAAYTVALHLLYIPGYTCTSYGGTEDKSKDLLATISTYLEHIVSLSPDRHSACIIKQTNRKIHIKNGDGDIGWVWAQYSKGMVRFSFILCFFFRAIILLLSLSFSCDPPQTCDCDFGSSCTHDARNSSNEFKATPPVSTLWEKGMKNWKKGTDHPNFQYFSISISSRDASFQKKGAHLIFF